MANKNSRNIVLGVISDTHGLLRPKVSEAFEGVHAILHAGDIGSPDIIDSLSRIAPVTSVRGNMDGGNWCKDVPATEMIQFNDTWIYMVHDLYRLDLDPESAGIKVVINGHTHRPLKKEQDNVLYLNPGSAGPRRYDYPVTVALLQILDSKIDVKFISIED